MLFIDEVHRLPRTVEEILYPAMEDFALDIIHRQGADGGLLPPAPAPVHLGGGHHRAGQLSAPLRDRFGVVLRLELVFPPELAK